MRTARLALLLVVLMWPAFAAAHIRLNFPNPRTVDQKLRHCGSNSPRANVSTFLPGQTITVDWTETINHLGYYRISFHPDGDTFRIPPGGGAPCADNSCGACIGTGTCNFPTEDFTGMVDPGGSTVIADRIADGTSTFDITLPDIECTNCTLQLIQVMTNGHGAYTEDFEEGNDIYYQCADMILSATAPDAAPGTPDASAGGPDGDPGAMGDGGGCCSTAPASPSRVLLALAVLGILVRRRQKYV
jgi:MYXO-CTERM domain-containing protein